MRSKKEIAAYHREWVRRNPERVEAYKRKQSAKRKAPGARLREGLAIYRITPEQFQALLAKQGGVCAICHREEPSGRRLSVDHDHRCCPAGRSCGGCVRGLLCSQCNKYLGYIKEDPSALARAIKHIGARNAQA